MKRILFSIVALCVVWANQTHAAEPDFARDVRPILSQHCFKCHGPDEKSRQAALRLDHRDSGLQGGDSGVPAIAPGKPDASELIVRITSSDSDSVMPPPSTKRVLTAEQIDILKRWVAAGAPYAEHWAFQPIKSSAAFDQLAANEFAHGVNPIDTYIAQAARSQQLELAGPSDRPTWLRRVCLDLLGIPPRYEEVQAYVSDQRPDAQQRVIDRLLASPAFGERWGRRWLDIARYADTNGYEKDRPRSIWPYRNWVIEALNDDMPQDQFAVEQLAGDLLPQPTQSQLIATGFHRNTMINEEGGIDPLEYRFYAMVDRVNTTSTAWLGMTVGCAQCHDHKYDPISQTDYYGLMALLNNAEEPEMEVVDPQVAKEQALVDAQIEELKRSRVVNFPAPESQLHPRPVQVVSVKSHGGLTWNGSGERWTTRGDAPDIDITEIELRAPEDVTSNQRLIGLRLKAIGHTDDPSAPLGWSDSRNFVITQATLSQADKQSLTLGSARATFEQPGYPAAHTLDANARSGWAVAGHAERTCEITWYLSEPAVLSGGAKLLLKLEQQFGSKHLLRGFELTYLFAESDVQPASQSPRSQFAYRQFEVWLKTQANKSAYWQTANVSAARANMARLELQSDGSYVAIGDITKRDEYIFDLAELPAGTTALMIEALPDPSMPKRGPGRTYYEGPAGDFFLSEVTLSYQDQPVEIKQALVDFSLAGREAEKVLDGDPLTGWSIDGRQGEAHRLVIRLNKPLTESSSAALRLLFERYYAAPLGRVRLWYTTATRADEPTKLPPNLQNDLWWARTEEGGGGPEQKSFSGSLAHLLERSSLGDAFLDQAPELAGVNAQISALRQSRPRMATTLVMQPRPDGFVRPTHRYHRGEFLNPREIIEPHAPGFLQQITAQSPSDRLQLARWLMRPDHPLTSRVLANRYWSSLMGRGLVSTEEDFGYQGNFPSNGPLLDWLASQLVGVDASGGKPQLMWSLKRWIRLVVSSDAYVRASNISEGSLKIDPSNVHLSRASRRRLEGEQLRDAALASAGLLSRQIGGPSVYPPQPASITTEGTYGGLAWPESHGADRYRRSLYTFSKRTAPFAMLATFDAPSGEACLARRESTDTPLQALTVLNDTLIMESASELGYRVVHEVGPSEPHKIIDQLFQRVLLRQPTVDEAEQLRNYFIYQVSTVRTNAAALKALGSGNAETTIARSAIAKDAQPGRPEPDPVIAAATLVARVLLNTDEFINRN